MTQARRAQREILAGRMALPDGAEGCVGRSLGADGALKYFFEDKSMIRYAPGDHWPDVWTLSYRVKKGELFNGFCPGVV